MGTLALLSRRTARRQKLQLATTALLVALAAMLINLGVLCASSFPQSQDASTQRLRAADVFAHSTDRSAADALVTHLRADDRVREVTTAPIREAWATFDYDGKTTHSSLVYFVPDGDARLGRSEIVAEAGQKYQNPVWLPYIFHAGGGYQLGDDFTVNTLAGSATFRVQGFHENTFLGLMAMGFSGVGVDQADFHRLASNPAGGKAGTMVQARAADPGQADSIVDAAVGAIKADYAARGVEAPMVWPDTLPVVRMAAGTGAQIYAASIIAFATVIALVVLVVVRFVIRTAVVQDMTALGTLAAAGVTTRQALWGIAAPAALVTLLAAPLGVAASYLLVPMLVASMEAQAGTRWEPGVSGSGLLLAVAVMLVTVLLTALLAARGVRRVTPVEAVRGGQGAHSFRRSVLPLATTRGPLGLLLGLKQAVQHLPQNAMVLVVVALVTFAGMFSAGLYTNVLGDRAAFLHLLVGDTPSAVVQVHRGAEPAQTAALVRSIRTIPGVERAVAADQRVVGVGGTQVLAQLAPNFDEIPRSSVYSGREPKHANEIAVGGKLAQMRGESVGDTLTVDAGSGSGEFLITGLLSTVNYAGMKVDLTDEGFRRMVPPYQPEAIRVYLTPGTSYDSFAAKLAPAHHPEIMTVTDFEETIGSQIDVYITMCAILAGAVLVGTGLVIALVMSLVTTTVIVRSRRSLGVRKALGFTTRQLIGQTVWAHLPVVAAGTVLGAGLGLVLVGPALVAMLSGVGVMSMGVSMQPGVVTGLCLGIVLLAAVMILGRARRIRGISAYRLFHET